MLPGGYGGVDIFFVISGFVVSAALHRLNATSLSEMLAGFYVRRLRRILPALVVMLLTVQFAVILFVPQAYLSRFIPDTGLAAFWGVSNFYLAWNTDYFSPLAHYNPFTHTWSLAVEEQFYVLFPFFLYVLTRSGRITGMSISAILVICIVSLVYGFAERGSAGAFYSSLGRFWEIGVGVLLFMWFEWKRLGAAAHLPRVELHVLTWCGSALIAISLAMPLARDQVPGALLPVVGATLLILGLHERRIQSWPGRLLASRPMVWIGLLSYSLYLWHWPVFVLARWTFGFSEPLQKLAALTVACGLATASFFWVERPLRSSRHLRQIRVVAPAALAVMLVGYGLVQGARLLTPSISFVSASRAPEQWYPYDLLADAQGCGGEKTESELGMTLRTEIINTCLNEQATGTIHIVGDSHAGAYIRMLDGVARGTGMRVIIREVRGCGIATLQAQSAACATANAAAIEEMAGDIKEGDIVFLPGLRVPRKFEQWLDGEQDADALMQQWAAGLEDANLRTKQELAPLIALGVPMVFELPKPVFAAPAYRCADWFNARNDACGGGFETTKAEIEALRAPVLAMAKRLAVDIPQLTLWDPLPVLCPETTCSAFRNGEPLFFDADHVSGVGSAMLAASFTETLHHLNR